jgi:hypothetical protein
MIFPTLDLSNPEKAARRRWKHEAPKFDCADQGWSPHFQKKKRKKKEEHGRTFLER